MPAFGIPSASKAKHRAALREFWRDQKTWKDPLPPNTGALEGRPANDITGQTLNGCLVVERAPSITRAARWRVIASCGHEELIEGIELRRRHNFNHPPYMCRTCSPSRVIENIPKTKRTCSSCGAQCRPREMPGATTVCVSCLRRRDRPAEPVDCKVCFDQPWRRPVDGCACGGAYADEDMRTVRYHIMTNNRGGWQFPDHGKEYEKDGGREVIEEDSHAETP